MLKISKNFTLFVILFFVLAPLVSYGQTDNFLIYPDSEIPVILPRSVWDNSSDLNALLTWLPQNESAPSDWQPVERIIIHHSATPTNDSFSPIQRIQSIYRFHAVTRGWGDIGYNYIIDQQGKIYEGRYGGNGSRGAHTYNDDLHDNFNYGSIGIVLLGDYSSQDIGPIMYESLSRLVGWLSVINNLEPQQSQKSSLIWNLSKGGFTSSYTGSIILGHKDIDNTTCPGIINLAQVRQKAAVYKTKYQNYVYQAKESNLDNNIYQLTSGIRKTIQSAGSNKIAFISISQLNLFSENRFSKYADGTLLQVPGQAVIYLMMNGKLRPFETVVSQITKLGFDPNQIQKISVDELALYPKGLSVKYGPDKTLVKIAKNPAVYFIENGRLKSIGSAALFNFLGFIWSKIKTISQTDFDSYLQDKSMTYPDGTLVKSAKTATVYLIKDNQLHPFISAETFNNLKYKWKEITILPTSEITNYSVGSSVKYPDGTLIKAQDNPTIYVIKNNQREPILSAQEFAKSGYKWASILNLTVNEFNGLYPEPQTLVSTPVPVQTSEPIIRIGIYAVPQNQDVIISANGSYNFCVLNNNCQTAIGQTKISYSASAYAKFIPLSETVLEIVSYEDHPTWKPSLNYNRFRGNLEIKYSPKSKQLWVVNELKLEDYLKGMAETTQEDPYQYIKTQLVAARTYALYYIKQGGKYGSEEIFYLKNSTSDQLYKGYGREEFTPLISKAAEETKGEAITYNSNVIVAAYSSGASFIQEKGTRSACAVWAGSYCQSGYEYLAGGIKDPTGAEYKYTTCSGANHCVGLSGSGSRRWTALGKNYQEILKYYYPGVKIEKIY